MYGPEGRTLNFNAAWCKAVQSQVSILKHSKKMYHEHENMTFLLNAAYTKILIYIEKKWKKCLGPGPRAPMVATPMHIIYNSFVASNFNYCPLVWHFCGQVNNNKIEKLQERSLRIIHNDYESSFETLLKCSKQESLLTKRLKIMILEFFQNRQ